MKLRVPIFMLLPVILGSALAQDQACLREELSRQLALQKHTAPAQLEWDSLIEQEQKAISERNFKSVAADAEQGKFQALDNEALQVQWRVARATEKFGGGAHLEEEAMDELRHFFVHTLELKGGFSYLGDSGTRISILWRPSDGPPQVIKIPRFQRLSEFSGLKNGAKISISTRKYGEFLHVLQYADAIQSREDLIMEILSERGFSVAAGKPLGGRAGALLNAVGGRVSKFIEGPSVIDVVDGYREKMGGGQIQEEVLPPLLKSILTFEDAMGAGVVQGAKAQYYRTLRDRIVHTVGEGGYTSQELRALLLEGKSKSGKVVFDINAGRNAKIDPRFWARDAKRQLLSKSACVGGTLLWVSGYCIQMASPQLPTFIDL